MEQKELLTSLFQKYLDNKCSPGEVDQLFELLESEDTNSVKAELIGRQFNLEGDKTGIDETLTERLKRRRNLIQQEMNKPEVTNAKVYKLNFYRWVAAASIVLLIGAGTYFLFFNHSSKQDKLVELLPARLNNDIAPGSNKAVLTLADNTQIILDSAANGTLTQQGNTKVIKLDNGQLAYNLLTEKPTEVVYNTITTPRGGQYQLVLSDGSKVWLNAASSIRFPANFVGTERKVELTGEAYFEVAKDETKKFIVDANGVTTEVLGTHFNVNAYDDEAAIKITLLEGSVKVSTVNHSVTSVRQSTVIKPGQQAQVDPGNSLIPKIKVQTVDMDEVVAWKNGEFQFGDKADIKTIMRQISRWYDVKVEYSGNVSGHIGGSISRNVNVSQVLQMLEKTGGVKFKVEGNKITVMP